MELSLSPVLFVGALAAGMISFASPCVLPLVPAYLGFITGRSAEELQEARGPLGLPIERDLYFRPSPFSEVIKRYRAERGL